MPCFLINTVVLAGLAVQAANAANIKVNVGKNGATISPDVIKANVGDTLEFHFHGNNYSVVMGTFLKACEPATEGGFSSGLVPSSNNANTEAFVVKLQNDAPTPLYSSQGNLCKNGMVGVINPKGNQTLEAYKALARSASNSITPLSIYGGQIISTTAPKVTNSTTGVTASANNSSSTELNHSNPASPAKAGNSTNALDSSNAKAEGNNATQAKPNPSSAGSISASMASLVLTIITAAVML